VAFVTDADVKVIHDRIAQEWSAIAQAASAQSVKLTPEQITQLGLLGTRIQSVLDDSPSFFRSSSQMNTAEALEADLFAYVASLRASGVSSLPTKPAGPTASTIDKLVELAPFVLIALVLMTAGKK
jgi:hypothetical protein